jgi:hypothetical protein
MHGHMNVKYYNVFLSRLFIYILPNISLYELLHGLHEYV